MSALTLPYLEKWPQNDGFFNGKMPNFCRLSFHPNLIVTQQTSIFIIKFRLFCAYFELFKKIAMSGSSARTC